MENQWKLPIHWFRQWLLYYQITKRRKYEPNPSKRPIVYLWILPIYPTLVIKFCSYERQTNPYSGLGKTPSLTYRILRYPNTTKSRGVIGRLLKVDVCKSSSLRGIYAKLCIELPMDEPVKKFIFIGRHRQLIHYEADNYLCKSCGRLGHKNTSCPQQQSSAIESSSTPVYQPSKPLL